MTSFVAQSLATAMETVPIHNWPILTSLVSRSVKHATDDGSLSKGYFHRMIAYLLRKISTMDRSYMDVDITMDETGLGWIVNFVPETEHSDTFVVVPIAAVPDMNIDRFVSNIVDHLASVARNDVAMRKALDEMDAIDARLTEAAHQEYTWMLRKEFDL